MEANFTTPFSNTSEPIWITRTLRFYYMPVLVITGILGSLVSMAVFLKTRLKKHSSSYYLAAMAASDTLFLTFLFGQWLFNNRGLQGLMVDALSSGAGCKMMNYAMYTCASISVWLTVAFTTERCIAVQCPLHRASVCTVGRAKVVISLVAVTNTIAYLYLFTTVGRPAEFDSCGFYKEYIQLMRVVSVVEVLLMVGLPFAMIACMNALIIRKLWTLSDVFHASDTRNLSARTCEGTEGTPLSPTPQQSRDLHLPNKFVIPRLLPESLNCPKNNETQSNSNLDNNEDRMTRNTVSLDPDKVTQSCISKQTTAESNGIEDGSPFQLSTERECGKRTMALEQISDDLSPSASPYEDGNKKREKIQGFDELSKDDFDRKESGEGVDDAKMEMLDSHNNKWNFSEAELSEPLGSCDRVVKSSVDTFPTKDKKYTIEKNITDKTESVKNNTKEMDGEKNSVLKDEKNEKVFIDVNIRVIIDNTSTINGRTSSERELPVRSRFVRSNGEYPIKERNQVAPNATTVNKNGANCNGSLAQDTPSIVQRPCFPSECFKREDKCSVTRGDANSKKHSNFTTVVEQQLMVNKRAVTVLNREGSGDARGITEMLVLISTLFIVLQLPSAVLRLYVILTDATSQFLLGLQRIFNDLYFSHFSINFLVYSTCGSNFRQCLRQMVLSSVRNFTARFHRQQNP